MLQILNEGLVSVSVGPEQEMDCHHPLGAFIDKICLRVLVEGIDIQILLYCQSLDHPGARVHISSQRLVGFLKGDKSLVVVMNSLSFLLS